MEHSNDVADSVEFTGRNLKPDVEGFDKFCTDFFTRVGVEVGIGFEDGRFFIGRPGGLGGKMGEHGIVPCWIVARGGGWGWREVGLGRSWCGRHGCKL